MSGALLKQYELKPGTGLVTVGWEKGEGFVVKHLVKVWDPRQGNIYSEQSARTYATRKSALAAGARLYKKIMDEFNEIMIYHRNPGLCYKAGHMTLALLKKHQLAQVPHTKAGARAWLKRLASSPAACSIDGDPDDLDTLTRPAARRLRDGAEACVRILGGPTALAVYNKAAGL